MTNLPVLDLDTVAKAYWPGINHLLRQSFKDVLHKDVDKFIEAAVNNLVNFNIEKMYEQDGKIMLVINPTPRRI